MTATAKDYTPFFPDAKGFALERIAKARLERFVPEGYEAVVQRRADGRWLTICIVRPDQFLPVYLCERNICITSP